MTACCAASKMPEKLSTSTSGAGGIDGANSAVIVRDSAGHEIIVALPQTGSFADLRAGDTVFTAWRPDKARCYPVTGSAA